MWQHERHDSGAVFSKEDYHAQHGLTQERYHHLKEEESLCPAPVKRDVEIAKTTWLKHQNHGIVQQMTNGVFVRMAILEPYWRVETPTKTQDVKRRQ